MKSSTLLREAGRLRCNSHASCCLPMGKPSGDGLRHSPEGAREEARTPLPDGKRSPAMSPKAAPRRNPPFSGPVHRTCSHCRRHQERHGPMRIRTFSFPHPPGNGGARKPRIYGILPGHRPARWRPQLLHWPIWNCGPNWTFRSIQSPHPLWKKAPGCLQGTCRRKILPCRPPARRTSTRQPASQVPIVRGNGFC